MRSAARLHWPLLLAISACAGPAERAVATRGNTITIVCDPALCGGPFGDTRSLLFLSLTTGDVLEGGEPKPLLAERWEHSADYREWTIHLRSGVRWHDGRPVTARDIEFTMRLFAHPDVLRPQAGALESATALDDSTVRIRYSKPSRAPLVSGIVYYQVIPYARIQILWNQRHAPFRDATVRRALTMALDRRELHGALNLPGDLPLTDGIFTVQQYRQGDLVAPLPFDPEAAKVLLDAAGWRVGRDGVRERNGIPFRFSLLVSGGGYLGQPAQGAVLIQEQLRRVGVREDVPAKFLYPKVDAHAAHRRVQGLESPYRGDPFWFLARLRLEER